MSGKLLPTKGTGEETTLILDQLRLDDEYT
jgi:hypothetical protein